MNQEALDRQLSLKIMKEEQARARQEEYERQMIEQAMRESKRESRGKSGSGNKRTYVAKQRNADAPVAVGAGAAAAGGEHPSLQSV